MAVKEVLGRLRSYQTGSGGFAYWPGNSDVAAWASNYTAHFMLEAEKRGFLVNDAMKRSVLNHLRQMARGWRGPNDSYRRSEEFTQAYRLYVLALGGTPETGAMNRLRENNSLDPMARWMLAAAYAIVGRADVAGALADRTAVVNYAYGRYGQYDGTYGSDLRDAAIRLITLCALDRSADAASLAKSIAGELSSDRWISTQSTAFALMAMSRFIEKYQIAKTMEFSYKCAGKSETVKTQKHFWSETLLEKTAPTAAFEIKNTSSGTLFARIITEGIPDQGAEEAYANGLQFSVQYQDMKGRPIDVSELEQGVNFTVVTSVKNPTATAINNVALTQIFPAGWEILNTRFTDENAGNVFPRGVNYQDIRDDRVYSYMDRLASGQEVTVRINLAAVYAGRFYAPPVYVEAMYDYTLRANSAGSEVVVK